ncbi:DUF6093 family protein [Streptomyces mirabilis]|uniref:DUF6093 family protein n=1 Tax=Streptomyces mirabilis TaxID=68239 RepID=UPI0033A4A650
MEGFLSDSVELWRDVRGEADDVLDEESGALRPAEGAELIWAGAGAVVLPGGLPAASPPVDGAVAQLPSNTMYQGMLPLSTPRVRGDDLLTVVDSARDAQLIGCRFRVTGIDSSSLSPWCGWFDWSCLAGAGGQGRGQVGRAFVHS